MRMGDRICLLREGTSEVERDTVHDLAVIWTILAIDGDRAAVFRDSFSGCEIIIVPTTRLTTQMPA